MLAEDKDADPEDGEASSELPKGFHVAALPPQELPLEFQKENPKADELT
jgi:hypothetical protein